jgi:hypothetical protein
LHLRAGARLREDGTDFGVELDGQLNLEIIGTVVLTEFVDTFNNLGCTCASELQALPEDVLRSLDDLLRAAPHITIYTRLSRRVINLNQNGN